MRRPGLRPAVILAQGAGSLGAARVLGRRGVPVIAVLWDTVTPVRYSRYAQRTLEIPPGSDAEREAYLLRLLTGLGRDRPVLLASSDRLIAFVARHRFAWDDPLPGGWITWRVIKAGIQRILRRRRGRRPAEAGPA
jgi:predicted ATP-grasp superfamily ATP-dependent carboligase